MQKASYNAMVAQNGNNFFDFTRNINDTGRQYAAVWSGDPDTTFQALQTSIINGVRSGLMNFPMWGSDTGGYSGSAPSKELYARWFGFSTYSPMMEVMQMPGRTIWFDYDKTAPPPGQPTLVAIAAQAAQTHHDLMPYTYSLAAQNTVTGAPIMRAMFLDFPNDPVAQTLSNQYMYGPGLLVAPVYTQGATTRTVYLPAGNWLNYNDRMTHYIGGGNVTVTAPMDVTPVFVREGAIIPRGDILRDNNNWTANWTPSLRIEFFPAITGSSSFAYYDGAQFDPISSVSAADGIHIAMGDLKIGGLIDVYASQPADVLLDGVETAAYSYDPLTELLRISFDAGATTLDLQGSQSMWAPLGAAALIAEAPVPEPATAMLTGMAACGLLLRRRRPAL
jgi:alpha-glucosidase (family GH31 glycosyl hydrolase)